MARVKRGVFKRKRRRKLIRRAKGYLSRRHKTYRAAKQALLKAGQYARRDRRVKKRQFRRQQQVQINAAARTLGISYSRFMGLLRKQKIALARPVLAELAQNHPLAWKALVQKIQRKVVGRKTSRAA
jgi:large subunit ribosomal protein L20